MKKKACKNCKMFVEEDECSGCKGNSFSTNWQGRLYIVKTDSQIAQKIGAKREGEYAIKVK